jgi:hypothetical protein
MMGSANLYSLNPPTQAYPRLQEFVMPVKAIQLGQVWRNNENGEHFLVTKVYRELFTQYAMLRPADGSAPQADTVRVKVSAADDGGVTLPGYTFTQESSHDF